MTTHSIELKTLGKQHLAAVRFRATIPELPHYMGDALGAVMSALMRSGTQPSGPAVAYYQPRSEGQFDVAAGFLVSAPIVGDGRVVPVELPACDAATTVHDGPYDDLPRTYEAVLAWMARQGHAPAEAMWEEYLTGPEVPPERMRTAVYWPAKPQ